MFTNDGLQTIVEEIDVLLAEIRELNASGPNFRIVHRFHHFGSDCAPGEEVLTVCLVHRVREFQLRLSLALRILFDYMARHSCLAQSAAQIEAGIRADRFYLRHASAVMGKEKFTRRIPRSYVRVYIERLRLAMKNAFSEAGLLIDPLDVLLTEETVMNEAGYRMRASFEWAHTDIR